MEDKSEELKGANKINYREKNLVLLTSFRNTSKS